MGSAADELWNDMRGYLREDAGGRPEFTLTNMPWADAQRVYEDLAANAQSVEAQSGAPAPEHESTFVFLKGLRTEAGILPPLGIIFSPREVAFFWTHEEQWERPALMEFVDFLLDLQRGLPGTTLEFQPRRLEPYDVQSRAALARYVAERRTDEESRRA